MTYIGEKHGSIHLFLDTHHRMTGVHLRLCLFQESELLEIRDLSLH